MIKNYITKYKENDNTFYTVSSWKQINILGKVFIFDHKQIDVK